LYRAANGEIRYRDFSYQYPTLAIALISPVLHWVGATLQAAQVIYDFLGLECVFGIWFLARRLMPSMAAFLATLGFIFCGGGGSLAVFHLHKRRYLKPSWVFKALAGYLKPSWTGRA
jgi:hypothetical protein